MALNASTSLGLSGTALLTVVIGELSSIVYQFC